MIGLGRAGILGVQESALPSIPVGTTCSVWTHQSEALEEQTLKTLAASPVNKMRMCVFPKHDDYNTNEPPRFPFEGSLAAGWDGRRPHPAFFDHLEKRIADLDALGIECDLIVFHPYDHTRSWITHGSLQRVDGYKTSEATNEWREWWKKPIVIDECAYEGNINGGWGNTTGEEMTRRFWAGAVRGGYVGHGETYLND